MNGPSELDLFVSDRLGARALEAVTAPEAGPSQLDLFVEQASQPGGTPDNPLEEGGLDFGDRLAVTNLDTGGDNILAYLAEQGYEPARNSEGRIVVRSPDGKYRVADPPGLDLLDPLDLIDDIALAVGSALGAIGAAGAAIPTGPGALAAGAAGGAAGAAGVEAARRGVAGLLGIEQSAGDVAKGIAGEAALGAGGEILGAGLGLAGRALRGGARAATGAVGDSVTSGKTFREFIADRAQRPLRRELAREVKDQATRAQQAARLGKRAATERVQVPKAVLAERAARKKTAKAELERVTQESQAELRERLARSGVDLERTLADGREQIMKFADTSKLRVESILSRAASAGARSQPVYSSLVVRPEFLRADAIRAVPELQELLRRNFGENFVSYLNDPDRGAVIFNSLSMKNAEKKLADLRQIVGDESFAKRVDDYGREFIELVFGDERFAPFLAKLSDVEKKSLAEAAGGRMTEEATGKLAQVFRETLSAQGVDPKVYRATMAYDREKQRLLNTEALFGRSQRRRDLEQATFGLQRADTAATAADIGFAREVPKGGNLFRNAFARPSAESAARFGLPFVGFAAGGPIGALVSVLLQSEPSRQVGRRVAAYAGRSIAGETRLGKALLRAPTAVSNRLRPALEKMASGKVAKGKLLLQTAIRSPEVRAWMAGRGDQEERPEGTRPAASFMRASPREAVALAGSLPPGPAREKLLAMIEDSAGDAARWRMQSWIAFADPEIRAAIEGTRDPEITAAVGR